ncbi:MAG: DMT family transporter [Burkholderiales bacterium]|nr:DMT family transporter [Burkholderiales bacterium]
MNFHAALLLLVTLVWGTTFPVLKNAALHLSGLEVSALRFLVAAVCMAPFAFRCSRAAWRDGALLGAVALISYVSQAYGLQFISSNRSAFLTSLNVLLVPLLAWLLGGKLSLQLLLAAGLACAGIGFMSWEGGASWSGDSATLVCALSYAAYVLMLARMVQRHTARTLAATQIVMMALFGTVLLALEGGAQLASLPARLQPALPAILYLGVIATAAMLFLQAIGQQRISAAKAALIFALEPAFAALFAWIWLGELLSQRAAMGGALVVLAVVLSEWKFASATRLSSAE